MYDITFSNEINNSEKKSFCIFKRQGSASVILKQAIEDGVYIIKLPATIKWKRKPGDREADAVTRLQSTSTHHTEKASEWHKRLVHQSAERSMEIMNKSSEIPRFSTTTVQSILCHPGSI